MTHNIASRVGLTLRSDTCCEYVLELFITVDLLTIVMLADGLKPPKPPWKIYVS